MRDYDQAIILYSVALDLYKEKSYGENYIEFYDKKNIIDDKIKAIHFKKEIIDIDKQD